MFLVTLLRFGGAAASIYMLLCIVRIFMTWLPGMIPGVAGNFVVKATEPYLGYFRRFSFLVIGNMDLSPIAALAVLSGFSRALTIASQSALTIGTLLALFLDVIWGPVGFLISFFALAIAARIVAYVAHLNSLHPVWRTVDAMINPVLFKLKRLVYRDRIVNYMQGLVTGLLMLVALRFGLGFVVTFISRFLRTF
ncbi:MAG: YggT family protein [Spirochaetota bacterium]